MIAEARSPDKLPGLATFYNSQSSPAPRRSHPEPAAPGRSKIPALPEGLSQAGFLAPTDIVWAGNGSDNGRRTQYAATGRSGAAPAITAGLANPPRWVGASTAALAIWYHKRVFRKERAERPWHASHSSRRIPALL